MQTTSDQAFVSPIDLASPAGLVGYLGAAQVLAGASDHVVALLADNTQVRVTLAFTFPFVPQAGDCLLVLGQDGAYFAVGVLGGSAPRALRFAGDAEIRTVGGSLTLASDTSVQVVAPKITLRAGVLRAVARSIIERADSMQRWVRGLLAVRARESRRQIDGDDSTRCQRSTVLAKETVKLDGDQLHLGH